MKHSDSMSFLCLHPHLLYFPTPSSAQVPHTSCLMDSLSSVLVVPGIRKVREQKTWLLVSRPGFLLTSRTSSPIGSCHSWHSQRGSKALGFSGA